MCRQARNLVSGDIIVTNDGQWDRVHGVDVDGDTTRVRTDSNRNGQYPSDATVQTAY